MKKTTTKGVKPMTIETDPMTLADLKASLCADAERLAAVRCTLLSANNGNRQPLIEERNDLAARLADAPTQLGYLATLEANETLRAWRAELLALRAAAEEAKQRRNVEAEKLAVLNRAYDKLRHTGRTPDQEVEYADLRARVETQYREFNRCDAERRRLEGEAGKLQNRAAVAFNAPRIIRHAKIYSILDNPTDWPKTVERYVIAQLKEVGL